MQTPEASTSSRRGLGAHAPRPSAPTPRLEGRGPGGDTPEARRVARVLGTSGVRGLCAEPPRRRAAWPPPPVGAVEVETGPAVGTGARRPYGSRVDVSSEWALVAHRECTVRCLGAVSMVKVYFAVDTNHRAQT